MRKKEPLLPVLILGLLAFTVLWPLWFTVDGALMASDELTAALGPALLDTADGGYAVWTILPSWPTLQPLAELLLDTPQFFSVFWNTCLLAFAQIAGQLVVAAPASWAFAKLRFAGRRFLLLGYIALMPPTMHSSSSSDAVGVDQVGNPYAQTAGIQVGLSVLPGHAARHCRGLQAKAPPQKAHRQSQRNPN